MRGAFTSHSPRARARLEGLTDRSFASGPHVLLPSRATAHDRDAELGGRSGGHLQDVSRFAATSERPWGESSDHGDRFFADRLVRRTYRLVCIEICLLHRLTAFFLPLLFHIKRSAGSTYLKPIVISYLSVLNQARQEARQRRTVEIGRSGGVQGGMRDEG